jgi:hypothetical protein
VGVKEVRGKLQHNAAEAMIPFYGCMQTDALRW